MNGGAITLGHPVRYRWSGVLGTVLDELELRDQDTVLITLCKRYVLIEVPAPL